MRRVERALIDEYSELVHVGGDPVDAATHAPCVRLAELPDMIRGYEDIKLDNVARYHERVAELRTQIEGATQ